MNTGLRTHQRQGKLWGGRFASGPSPELEALSRSTHFDWRLTPLRHRRLARPRQGARRRRAAHAGRRGRAARGPGRADPPLRGRRAAARPLRRGRARRPGAAAARGGRPRARRPAAGRAVPQRPDRHPAPDVPARPRAGGRRAACSTWSTRWPQQGRAHLGAVMPGRTHLQHAQPVLLTHHLLAHAWPLVRDVDRLADWAAPHVAESPYGWGALAGTSLGLDPDAGGRASWASPASAPTRSTAPRRATSSPSSPSSAPRSAWTSAGWPRS